MEETQAFIGDGMPKLCERALEATGGPAEILEVIGGGADGKTGGGIANLFHVLKVTVGVTRFPFRGGAEHGGHVVFPFHVGLGREVEVAAVGLGFAGKGGLQVFEGLAIFQIHEIASS